MSGFVTKDSGERARFDSGMQRDTEAGKARFDLLIPLDVPYQHQFFTRVAELMGRGAEKYEDRNWEKANSEAELARMKSSAYRHFMQWLTGETDEDHAAATVFNLLAHETTRFKMDNSNALETEDPLVDLAFVGTDRPLLDRLAYWSKRLQRAQAEEPNPGDEIEYAEENLGVVLDLLEDHDLEYVEAAPGPLGEGWQTVGYVDETQNWPDSNSFAILRNPDYDLPFREPTPFLRCYVDPVVEWKDPELPTAAKRADFPRVHVDHWVKDYDAEYPKFGAFQTIDLKPYVVAMDEHIRKLAEMYAWPRTIMAGLPTHRTFIVDSDGEIEIEDLLQDAFNRRGIITT